jgi:glycosyltransferase involved in cell wall biosynthesis
MLINKGVCEFAEAAAIVRHAVPSVCFQLLGPVNEANPNSVSMRTIRAWQDEGRLEYLGATEDVRPYIADADCVVLPSYREGVPRTLLEAAAMAVPIIATDVPGCRDVDDDQVNGMLCRVRDAQDLAAKMLAVVGLPPAQRQRMGALGRQKVEREFDETLVIRKYLDAIADVVGSRQRNSNLEARPASRSSGQQL